MTKKEAKKLLDEFNIIHAEIIIRGRGKHFPKEVKLINGYWYYKGFRIWNISQSLNNT